MNTSSLIKEKVFTMLHTLPWIFGWASMAVVGPFMFMKLFYNSCSMLVNAFANQDKKMQGKVVLITGASSGLGEAIAHVLYSKGCRLILASRDTAKLNKLKEVLLASYKPVELHVPLVLKLDLEDVNGIPDVVSDVLSTVNHIDVLINNAGRSYRGDVISTDISVDIKLMLINYFGQVSLIKAILPKMIERKSGHIIGISSIQGKFALPYRSCYTASKHAFQSFLDTLRAEVAEYGIDVSVVSPGYIATNLSKNALTSDGSSYNVTDPTTAKGMEPSCVANYIRNIIISKESDVILAPFHHKLLIFLRAVFPGLYRYYLTIRANNNRKTLPYLKKQE